MLNSSDRLYEELRDQSFAAVGPRLGEKAKAIQTNYQACRAREFLACFCRCHLVEAARHLGLIEVRTYICGLQLLRGPEHETHAACLDMDTA